MCESVVLYSRTGWQSWCWASICTENVQPQRKRWCVSSCSRFELCRACPCQPCPFYKNWTWFWTLRRTSKI
jgi:hypothetical protein